MTWAQAVTLMNKLEPLPVKTPLVPSPTSSTQPVAQELPPSRPQRGPAQAAVDAPAAPPPEHTLSPFEELMFSIPRFERYLDRADLVKVSAVSAPLYRNPPAGFDRKIQHEFYRDLAALTDKSDSTQPLLHILEAMEPGSDAPVAKLSNSRKADILAQIHLPPRLSNTERTDLFNRLYSACEQVAEGPDPVTHQFSSLADCISDFRNNRDRQAKYDSLYQRLGSAPKANEQALLSLFDQILLLRAHSRTPNWDRDAQRHADAFDAGLHFSTAGKKVLLESVLHSFLDLGLKTIGQDQRNTMSAMTQKVIKIISDLPANDRAEIFKSLGDNSFWSTAGLGIETGGTGPALWEILARGLFDCPTLPREETIPVAAQMFISLDRSAGNSDAASTFRERASDMLTRATQPSGSSRDEPTSRDALLSVLGNTAPRFIDDSSTLGHHCSRFDLALNLTRPIAHGPDRPAVDILSLGTLVKQLPLRVGHHDEGTSLPLPQVCDQLLTLCDQSSEPFRSILMDTLDRPTRHWPDLPHAQIQARALRQQVRQRMGDFRPAPGLGELAPGETKRERLEDIARLATATGSPLAFDLLMESLGPQADGQSGETPVSLEDKRAILQHVRPQALSPASRGALFAAHLALADDLARTGKASGETGDGPYIWLAQNLNAIDFDRAIFSAHYEMLRTRIIATSGHASREMEALMWNCGTPGVSVRRHEDQLNTIIHDLPALSDTFKARFIPKLYDLLLEDEEGGIDRSGAHAALLKDSFSIADTSTRGIVTEVMLEPVVAGNRRVQGTTFTQTRICLSTAKDLPLESRKEALVKGAEILGTVEDEVDQFGTAARPGEDRPYEDTYMELFEALRSAAQRSEDRETVSAVLAEVLEPYVHTWNDGLDAGLPAHVRAKVYDKALETLGPAGTLDKSAAAYRARHALVRLLPQRLELARDSAQQSDRIRQAVTRMVQESSEPIRTMLQVEMPAQQT